LSQNSFAATYARSPLSAQPELELHGCYIGNDSDGQQENIFGEKYILRRWREDCGRLRRRPKFQGSISKTTSGTHRSFYNNATIRRLKFGTWALGLGTLLVVAL
jgi:hypothetical protein